MIPIEFIMLGFALFAIGMAGMATSRHLVVMMMSIEVALVASTLVATAFFYLSANGAIVPLLFTVWSVAAVEAILIIVFYKYMARNEMSLDVSKLSELKD
ncbi:hypothetical protein M1329_01855 [Candidatus Marsarchaeota archaeon]|jgi:NADH:ubiquinone oxidoreductase subunit K|nr:hypothetical protein [Candidatus Marsarchaeota archaeon]MCL5100060.1 hypothetical protein [Candidatus Marsarchaeota archaeon]